MPGINDDFVELQNHLVKMERLIPQLCAMLILLSMDSLDSVPAMVFLKLSTPAPAIRKADSASLIC